MGSVYCQSVFERGSGLGNRMFPWARARLFAKANDATMLAPRWASPRLKPLFRKGTGVLTFPRQVMLVGQFQAGVDDLAGSRRRKVLKTAKCHHEPVDFASRLGEDCGPGSHLFLFEGDLTGSGRFHSLIGHDETLRWEFAAITRPRWLRAAAATASMPIGIHVRLGDFLPGPVDSFRTASGAFTGAWRTPLAWYIESLQLIRSHVGSWPAFVVSNGDPSEMRPLLEMNDVTLVRSQSPVADIWSLASCRVLIGSIGSTFTSWPSFLGQMPTVLYPLADAHGFPISNRHGYFNGLLDPSNPDPHLVETLRQVARV